MTVWAEATETTRSVSSSGISRHCWMPCHTSRRTIRASAARSGPKRGHQQLRAKRCWAEGRQAVSFAHARTCLIPLEAHESTSDCGERVEPSSLNQRGIPGRDRHPWYTSVSSIAIASY